MLMLSAAAEERMPNPVIALAASMPEDLTRKSRRPNRFAAVWRLDLCIVTSLLAVLGQRRHYCSAEVVAHGKSPESLATEVRSGAVRDRWIGGFVDTLSRPSGNTTGLMLTEYSF